ncbi:hypothetical protein ABZS63_18330, partial [Streptomyces sp. NPDC005568]
AFGISDDQWNQALDDTFGPSPEERAGVPSGRRGTPRAGVPSGSRGTPRAGVPSENRGTP